MALSGSKGTQYGCASVLASDRIVGSNSELIHLSRVKADQRHLTDADLHGVGAGPLAGYDDPTFHHVTQAKYLAGV